MNQHNPELPWLAYGYQFAGLQEVPGTKTNSTIRQWLEELGAWWKDDETAWCGVFIAICLKKAGFDQAKNLNAKPGQYPKNWMRALAYMSEGGIRLEKPCYGCVAVKTRKGGGHVTFIVGKTISGKLVGFGGNQSNKVCFAQYDASEFAEFMWYGKTNTPASHRYDLPILSNVTASKVSES